MTPSASISGMKVYDNFRQNLFEKQFNLHNSLKLLDVSALIVHGDADSVPSCTAQNIHESIKGSKYILMKNCGHFPYVEDPETYFKILNDFLKP